MILDKLMSMIDTEVKNSIEEYEQKGLPMIGTLPKGKGRVIEKEIPTYLRAGIANSIAMRLQAIELRKKADELEVFANSTLMPNLIVAEVKTVTIEGLGQVTYKEGSKKSSTYPVDTIKANALARGFTADHISQAFPEKVDPKAKFKELGYDDNQIKELWKSAEKKPDKEKGEPSIAFTSWESYQAKCAKKEDSKDE